MAIDIVAELAALLAALDADGAEYALCGGFAVGIHGYARATNDIDLLVPEAARPAVDRILHRNGFDVPSGPIPFGAGTENERVVHRFTKIDGSDTLSVDVLGVTPVFREAWD